MRIDTLKVLFGTGILTTNEMRLLIDLNPIETQGECVPAAKHQARTNCNNCGAVLVNDKCEYCKTDYSGGD